jgi:germacradienol/geosmin synthase
MTMQPFELPDFYVPWPARLNPNLDAARVHSKAWALEMGILDSLQDQGSPKIWDERAFDRHDYALLCAYIHPEAPTPELNLMADWNVWAFYVDDYFLQVYKRPKDHDGAKKYLDRVLLFMPVDLSPPPEPTNPMERGLADLWSRTAPEKSEAWRGRINESMRNLLQAFLWELDSMSQQRLANPIEYIEMRRQVGAALWSADLVEHAMFVEIPERIAATRPMRVLKDTFADGVHLRNDIFSYEREVLKEGELTNAILVIERFLSVDTQRAANLVNDLLTSRLQQFEHTVLTELVPMFQEYTLDPLEQANVLNYIRGLQDWQSGAHEWHIQTSRYLNPRAGEAPAIGSSLPNLMGWGAAARITPGTLGLNRFKNYMHVSYRTVGPTRLPEFYMPFTTSTSPYLEIARQHEKAWACQMGMLDTLPTHPGVFIWDEQRFEVTDLAFFSALAHPGATADQLDLAAYWVVWGTYTDDYFLAIYGRTHDLAGAKICHTRLSDFMPIESLIQSSTPLTPVERGLADLWTRTAVTLSLSERRLFRKMVEDVIGSWVWEIYNQLQHRIPDPVDYMEMRRMSCGSGLMLALPRSVYGEGIPPEVHQTLTMRELNNTAIDYAQLTNDIFSYHKEIEFEDHTHNGVLVIENFLGCDKVQAVEIVNNLMTARMKQFEHIAKTELPVLFENFDLDTSAREQLFAYVEALQRYMCGSLQWHIKTDRYKEFEFRRSARLFTGNPTGLGTAAAHLVARVGSRDDNGSTAMEPAVSVPPQAEEISIEASNTVKTFAVSHLAPPFIMKKEEA